MEPYSEIINNLYIGNQYSPHLLLPEGLGLIVNCTKDLPILEKTKSIRISVNDSPDECNNFIREVINTDVLAEIHSTLLKKQIVLVHCAAGVQRSCALVACYLIKYRNIRPVDEVIKFIKSKRKIAFFAHVNFRDSIEYFYYNE